MTPRPTPERERFDVEAERKFVKDRASSNPISIDADVLVHYDFALDEIKRLRALLRKCVEILKVYQAVAHFKGNGEKVADLIKRCSDA